MKFFLRFFLALCLAIAPVQAELTVNNLTGFDVGSSTLPATISFIGCTSSTSDASSHTFTDHATGTAGNRKTLVGVVTTDSATAFSLSSMTVGGSSAAEVNDFEGVGALVSAGFYIIDNPSGTTATIVVGTSEVVINMGVCVWALYDVLSSTEVDEATNFHTTSSNVDVSLDVVAGGVAAGVCITGNALSGNSHDWSGMAEVAESVVENATSRYSAADTTTPGSPLTVGCDPTSTQDAVAATVSFR